MNKIYTMNIDIEMVFNRNINFTEEYIKQFLRDYSYQKEIYKIKDKDWTVQAVLELLENDLNRDNSLIWSLFEQFISEELPQFNETIDSIIIANKNANFVECQIIDSYLVK